EDTAEEILTSDIFDLSTVERLELDLSNPEDWDIFLESAEDLYADAIAYETTAALENYKSLAVDEVPGEEIFTTLFQKLETLVQLIADAKNTSLEGGQSSDEDIDTVQNLYSDIAYLSGYVLATYESMVDEVTLIESESKSMVEIVLLKEEVEGLAEETLTEVVLDVQLPEMSSPEVLTVPEIIIVSTPCAVSAVLSETETERLLCGVALPEAGQAGVKTARTLRETLLLARDRDPIFIRDPKKQLAADKLIRQLVVIPYEGLSEEKITQIIALAEIIGFSPDESNLQLLSAVEEDVDDGLEIMVNGFGEQSNSRKVIEIVSGTSEVGTIPILVTKKAQKKYQDRKSKLSPVAASVATSVPAAAVVTKNVLPAPVVPIIDKRDSVKTFAPTAASRKMPTREVVKRTPLTDRFVINEEYRDFIMTYIESPEAFERILESDIIQIDAQATDAFESWLGEKFTSPFTYLQNMTVGEVLTLAAKVEVRAILEKQNIKYEAFVVWVDLIDEMQEIVGNDADLLFGELYVTWEIETRIEYVISLQQNHNSQVGS
ncbi:MAG: hypothetical protein RLZZ230_688, partial [Candidatus Parcubacteria bacterium]